MIRQQDINLALLKASNLEADLRQQLCQFAEFCGQQFAVPTGVERDIVVGQYVGTLLSLFAKTCRAQLF